MSDVTLNAFVASGTAAERIAFTPSPPTPAAGPDNGYFFFETDTGLTYSWDGAVWVQTGGGGATSVTAAGTLTSGEPVLGAGAKAVAVGPINLAGGASFVTGDLPYANLAQGSALSVLGVTGNATADNASIAAGSDHQVMRRSGTTVAFGQVNVGQSAAITGILPVANGGTGSATGAGLLLVDKPLTNSDILNWPTTPITVLAVPGANLRIHPIAGQVIIDTTAGVYGTFNANASMICTVNGAEWFSYLVNGNSTGLTQVTELFTAGTEAVWPMPLYVLGSGSAGSGFDNDWGLVAPIKDAQGQENKALVMSFDNVGTGVLSGGDAGNSGRIIVLYLLVSTL